MPAMWAGAAAALAGGLMSSKASSKASKAQQQAAQQAQAEVSRQYDTTREDLSPWRTAGSSAIDRLQFLLGIGGSGSTNPAVGSAKNALSQAESEYQALLGSASSGTSGAPQYEWVNIGDGTKEWTPVRPQAGQQPSGGGVDSASLAAARQRVDAARNALTQAQAQPFSPGAGYGSLMQPFGLADFQADPGYQFRQSEGLKGIENSAAARGMQLSGANLKGLASYNSGLASQEYGNAFARDASNKDRSYNYLSGVSNSGLNAAAQTGQFGAQAAGSVADLMTQGGNAQAAGIVGGAQGMQQGLQGVNSAVQYQELMQLLRGSGNGSFQYGTGPSGRP
jgi:hypothetical protein